MARPVTLKDFGYNENDGDHNNKLVKAVISGLSQYIESQKEAGARDGKTRFGKGPVWAQEQLTQLRELRQSDSMSLAAYNTDSLEKMNADASTTSQKPANRTAAVLLAEKIATIILSDPSNNAVSKFTELKKALEANQFALIEPTVKATPANTGMFAVPPKPRKESALVEWLARHTTIPGRSMM